MSGFSSWLWRLGSLRREIVLVNVGVDFEAAGDEGFGGEGSPQFWGTYKAQWQSTRVKLHN